MQAPSSQCKRRGRTPRSVTGAVLPLGLAIVAACIPGPYYVVGESAVAITLHAPNYRLGERISATISNHTNRPIYTMDEQTDCTVATLERWVGDKWKPVLGCGMGRLALVVAIPAGHSRVVILDPLSHNFVPFGQGSKPAFGVGRYRIVVAYRFIPDRAAPNPYVARSSTFRIRPAPAS